MASNIILYSFNISLYSKKKVIAAVAIATGTPLNEKNNSLRNTKFGIYIAFSIKMYKKPTSFKIHVQIF